MSPMLPIVRETLAKLESFPRDYEDTNQFVERWMRTLQGRAAMMLEAVEMIETCHPEYARRIIPEGTKEECIVRFSRRREPAFFGAFVTFLVMSPREFCWLANKCLRPT